MGHYSFVHKELINSELNYDFEQNWLLSTKRWGIRPSLLGLLITIRSGWSSVLHRMGCHGTVTNERCTDRLNMIMSICIHICIFYKYDKYESWILLTKVHENIIIVS